MDIREETQGDVLLIRAAGRLDSGSAGELEAVLPARTQEIGRASCRERV